MDRKHLTRRALGLALAGAMAFTVTACNDEDEGIGEDEGIVEDNGGLGEEENGGLLEEEEPLEEE